MSDKRQPRWNTGTVGDILHLGRTSQENKLPENMARQAILRQELKRQESRRSSQDHERQEIKPTVQQPVLNPKYASIQPTSDSGPPSDQILNRQDASAKLSTVNSVNPKKIQEDPPQKRRSNQEIPQQAVELQKTELRLQESRRSSQANEHQEIKPAVQQPVPNPKYFSTQSTSNPGLQSDQILNRQDSSAKLSTVRPVNSKKIEENPSQKPKSNQEIPQQAVELQKVDRRKVEPQKVEPQKVEPQKVGPQGPQKFEPQKVDPRGVRPQKLNSQIVDPQKVGPQKLEPQKLDCQQVDLQKVDPQKVGPQKLEPQKLDSHRLDPHRLDPQEVEPQKIGPQKIDRQKVDRQKVESTDLQESRHATPFHNPDHSPNIRANSSLAQLTTKTQETKSDRYTHNQGEYTAQYLHNNIPDQNPAKTNPFAKTTPQECPPVEIKSGKGEIEPQEVKPQDVVPIRFSLGQRALNSEMSLSQPSDKEVPFESKNIQQAINRPSTPKTSHGKPAPKPKKSIASPFNFLKGAKRVKTEELSQDDVIIAVMGPTGSGKSTFIEIATDFDTGVGHNLESCTSEINIVKLSLPELADGEVVFVDTPGFDDTHKSDVEILKMVADWLKTTYEKEILLSGLLYFHRISDNRMAGTPLKNLRMFEELCGKNALQNVILVTTMWDEVDEETGNLRERELKSKYWRSMLDYKSTTSRFMHTRESALSLIEPFVDAANAKSSLLLQQELVDLRAKLPATSAGVRVFSEMEDLVKQQQEVLKQMRNVMKQTNNEDQKSLLALQKQYQELRVKLDATVKEMQQLKLPLGKRLSRMTRGWFSFKFRF